MLVTTELKLVIAFVPMLVFSPLSTTVTNSKFLLYNKIDNMFSVQKNKQNVARTFDLILAKFHGAATSKPQVKGGEQTQYNTNKNCIRMTNTHWLILQELPLLLKY